jgi:hypothetical protein
VFVLFYRYGVSWNLLEKEWRCVEWRGIKIEHIRNLGEILQRNADESEREEKGRLKDEMQEKWKTRVKMIGRKETRKE